MALQIDEIVTRGMPAYRPHRSRHVGDGTYQVERATHIAGARALAWGYQRALDRRVLIERIAGLSNRQMDQAATHREAMLRLEHPHLARCIDLFAEAGALHLVLVPGTGKLLAEMAGTLGTTDSITVGIQLCNALNFARWHTGLDQDIVVDPSTATMTSGGRVKLNSIAALFGIATPRYHSRFAGTGGTSASRAAFSIGATLHFLLTGWSGVYREGAPSLAALRPDLPPAYTEPIMRALHEDPRRRWNDSVAFRYALLPLVS